MLSQVLKRFFSAHVSTKLRQFICLKIGLRLSLFEFTAISVGVGPKKFPEPLSDLGRCFSAKTAKNLHKTHITLQGLS